MSDLDALRVLLQEEFSEEVALRLSSVDVWDAYVQTLCRDGKLIGPEKLPRLLLLDQLWVISGQNVNLLMKLAHLTRASTWTVADIASKYYSDLPVSLSAEDQLAVQRSLYTRHPTAVLRGLVEADIIEIDSNVKQHVLSLFDRAITDRVDITKHSSRPIVELFRTASKLDAKLLTKSVEYFQSIQRLQAVVVDPPQVGILMKAKLVSASAIARRDIDTFQKMCDEACGSKIPPISRLDLERIRDHAVVITTRNEQTWATLLKSRSQDLAALEPGTTNPDSSASIDSKTHISYENLFKEIAAVSCEHCCSVLSPSAYFVDLLRMLDAVRSTTTAETLLHKFSERRGDLKFLELSCSNTNDLVEYATLVHEVLQSFAIALADRDKTSDPSKTTSDTPVIVATTTKTQSGDVQFDMGLHRDVISKLVFPVAAFPFNAASTSIALHLELAGTSRQSLLNYFSSEHRVFKGSRYGGLPKSLLLSAARTVLSRAKTARQLGLTHEEYVLLSQEAFYSREAYEIATSALSLENYRKAIGLQPVAVQWGYSSDGDMTGVGKSTNTSLAFIQAQLLPRAGISFQELVEVLRTQFLGRRLIIVPANSAQRFTTDFHSYRLRALPDVVNDKGYLTDSHCRDLMSFIRLQRKLNWSFSLLDTALSCLMSNRPGLDPRPSISPQILEGLADIQRIHSMVPSLEIWQLLPIWTDIDTFGLDSAYVKLFLIGNSARDRAFFETQDGGGRYLQGNAKMKEGMVTLSLALQVSERDLERLMTACGLTREHALDLANISSLYRYSVFAQLLQVDVDQLSSLLDEAEVARALEDPSATSQFLSLWKGLEEAGWTVDEILETTTKLAKNRAAGVMGSIETRSRLLISLTQSTSEKNCLEKLVRTEWPECDDSMMDFLISGIDGFSDGDKGPDTAGNIWTGMCQAEQTSGQSISQAYLVQSQKQAYTLEMRSWTDNSRLTLDGVPITGEVKGNVWRSRTVSLQRERTYLLQSTGDLRELKWLNSEDVLQAVGNNLVPASRVQNLSKINTVLVSYIGVIRKFELGAKEVKCLVQTHGTDDLRYFRTTGLAQLFNLNRFSRIRKTIETQTGQKDLLLHFLEWIANPNEEGTLSNELAKVTGSTPVVIDALLASRYPGVPLLTVKAMLSQLPELDAFVDMWNFFPRTKFAPADAPLLYNLADPQQPGTNSMEFSIAETFRIDMRRRIAGSTKESDDTPYNAVTRRLVDQCRHALIQFLINHDYMKELQPVPITDSDSLFEYFLIDVNMGTGLKTSRIKQAISTVHLYVQRCILGLEHRYGVPSGVIDQKLWEWMRSYPLWEANRKVFLYPENWLDPTVRDDKTELFKEFEAKMLQSNLDAEVIGQMVKSYIVNLNDISDLEIQAYLWDTQVNKRKIFHLFGRTRNAPYTYYYRRLDVVAVAESSKLFYWSPWEKMDVEISTFETDADGQALAKPGSYLLPTIRRGRLYLFIPQILLKNVPSAQNENKKVRELFDQETSQNVCDRYWEVRMGWTELCNGRWAAKKVSRAHLIVAPIPLPQNPPETPVGELLDEDLDKGLDKSRLPKLESFKFWVRSSSATGEANGIAQGVQDILNIDMECYQSSSAPKIWVIGRFQMRDYDIDVIPFHNLAALQTQPSVPATKDTEASPTTDSFAQLLQSTGKPTVTTYFSRLAISGTFTDPPKDELKWAFSGRLWHRGQSDKPLLANAIGKSPSKSLRQLEYVMSFDDAQAPIPTGLVLDMRTKEEGNSSWMFLPGDSMQSTDNTSVIWPMNNQMAPILMQQVSAAPDLETIYTAMNNVGRNTDPQKADESIVWYAFGISPQSAYHELARPFAVYNWEVGYHTVALVMERLLATRQLDLALRVARLVFDPTIDGDKVHRCWRFRPFQDEKLAAADSPRQILESLAPEKESLLQGAVQEWRDHPFSPHAVARNYPTVYMRRIVMKYIEILVAYGDRYFRQGTLESIPLAIQQYIQASQLLGARPTTNPPLAKARPRSFMNLENKFNAFAPRPMDLELDFPFVRDPIWRGYSGSAVKKPEMNSSLLGILQVGYFCVPENPQVVALRDLIDDRLYKIRNCQDINGKGVTLRLWDPPLDPGAIVQALGNGGSIESFLLSSSDIPLPIYRFPLLLQKAFDLCNELKGMTDQFLTIKDKRDAEAMAVLKSGQELALNLMTLDLKKWQRDEASKSLEGLQETRSGHQNRLSFYLQLIGEPDKAVQSEQGWQDIAQSIDKPTMDELRMSKQEKLEFDLSDEVAQMNTNASVLESVAAGLLAIPRLSTNAQPMGMGVSTHWDASILAQFMQGTAGVIRLGAQMKGDQATRVGRKAGYVRQLQERRLQANMAGRDIAALDKQIAAQIIRLKICESEIKIQEKQIEYAKETDLWYRTKYTNEKLYAWMENTFTKLHEEAYELAFSMARTAQRALDFEMGVKNGSMLRHLGYWDKARDGMFAGQSLSLDLRKIEKKFLDNRFYDFEISKSISLRQLDPMALLKFQVHGQARFAIPEMVYDFDFPGQYLRRIKSVSVSIPCITGPYTGINCTLELVQNGCRGTPLTGKETVQTPSTDVNFDSVPIKSIAISHGQNDNGVFDLNFPATERFAPFEGAGAASTWHIELPAVVRQFDYRTITDVIIHVKYTAKDAPQASKLAATKAIQTFITTNTTAGSPLLAVFDLKNDYPNEWRQYTRAVQLKTSGTASPSLELSHMQSRLPFWTKGLVVKTTTNTLVMQSNDGSYPGIVLNGIPQWTDEPPPEEETGSASATKWTNKTPEPPEGQPKPAWTWYENSTGLIVDKLTIGFPTKKDGKGKLENAYLILQYTVSGTNIK